MVSLDLWAIYGLRIITVPAGSSTALPAGKSQLKLNTEQGEIQIIIVLKTRKVSQVNQTQLSIRSCSQIESTVVILKSQRSW